MATKESTPDRIVHATQLVEDFNLNQDAEFFSMPDNRVAFLESLSSDDIFGIAQHVNARVRGQEPRQKTNAQDKGGSLPLLGTPSEAEKPAAFRAGIDTVKNYLIESSDTSEEKLKGAAMAVEALIIWVHPFNDGNGRTSRFLGKFIEDGTTDTDQLILETADIKNRCRLYDSTLRVDRYNVLSGLDLMLDDDEEAQLLKSKMPVTEGISLSLERLLEDPEYRARVERKTRSFKEIQERVKLKSAA